MIIKFGDIEYFELLTLRDRLKYWKYDKFDLEYLDKLKAEIDRKIESIHLEHNTLKALYDKSRKEN
jgi:hypothetical protein